MSDFFKELQQRINKNVKGVHASVLSESEIATERKWVKTPALDLNRILSGSFDQGLKTRTLCGIVGPEHTMKSSFMILCMVEAVKQGMKPVIIDTEGSLEAPFIERWGLDPKKVFYTYSPFVAEVRAVLAQLREMEQDNMIIALDSVGNLDRLKQFEDAAKGEMKADQGLLQKEIKSMLKLFLNICIKQNSIGIAAAHYYGKPSTVPMPDQIGGGKAVKLLPNILITLNKTHLLSPDKEIVGSKITATTVKNRQYPPFQKATIKLDYVNGLQPYAGLIDLAVKAGIINQKGAWFSYKDTNFAQGAANAELELANMPEIIEDLNEWLKTTGYSTVDENAKEAEKIIEDKEKDE